MVLIIASFLTSNGQAVIEKVEEGDTLVAPVPGVFIDIHTYRTIKQTGMTTDELVAQKTLFIENLQQQVDALDARVSAKDRRIKILQDDNIRKDLAITNLASINNQMKDEVVLGLDELKEEIRNKPFYLQGAFWSGVGGGLLLGVLLVNK
jgi:hypothetical protein